MNLRSPSDMTSTSKGKITTLELVVLSLMGALMFVLQVAFAFLPNIEPVSVMIIACTRVFGKKSFYPIYIFVLAEGLAYGFNLYWISYLYVWAILCVVTLIINRTGTKSILPYAFASTLFGLLFGALCAVIQLFAGGVSFAFSWWVSGIPFDLLHCAGNAATTLFLLAPLTNLLRYLMRHISRL